MPRFIAHDGKTKFCSACEEDKPLDTFALRSGRGGGRQSACKECRKEMHAAWYAEHKEEQTQRSRENYDPVKKRAWEDANRARMRQHCASRRARKLDQFIEDVDPEIVYQMHGGMCGICEEFIIGKFHVDHVIPLAKGGMHGYINVQAAHPKCNLVKGDR